MEPHEAIKPYETHNDRCHTPSGSPTSQLHNHNAVSIAGIRRTTLEFMVNNVKRWPVFGKTYMSEWSQFRNSFLCLFVILGWLFCFYKITQPARNSGRLGRGFFHRISICWLWGYVKVITVTHTSNITLHLYVVACHRSINIHPLLIGWNDWMISLGQVHAVKSLHDFSILWTEKNLVGWVISYI